MDKDAIAKDAMMHAEKMRGMKRTPEQIKSGVIARMKTWGHYTEAELKYARKSMYGKLDAIWKAE